MSLGIVVALAAEAQVLTETVPLAGEGIDIAPGLRLRLCGMGPEPAAQAAAALLAEGVGALLAFGTAGGLDPALRPGILLLPERVIYSGGDYAVAASWRSRVAARIHGELVSGPLLTVATACAQSGQKQTLHAHSGAVAVDMESGAVAAVATSAGKPFLVLRALVDPAERDLPLSAMVAVDAYGHLRLSALLAALARRPWEITALLRLGREMSAALQSLRTAWQELGPLGIVP
ncbi:phosphorylase family protein [Acidithiobacillus sp.]